MSDKKRKLEDAHTNVLVTLAGDLGTAEDAVKDVERAVQLDQFNLYDGHRRLADAHRMVYDKLQEIGVLQTVITCSED